eukprot:gb/GFBE01082987.1/.p1 GENE.gb/GFBE01082987.1/~~gb/GFBE01082987.1/.p1  ORF type:complete len:134 (+),score=35.91 gb/GFBE01082987.1/:1-402(+)
MAAAGSFTFEGKEFPLFTEKQLEGINRESLKQRGLNLRDHVGQDRLPPMPRQPEALVSWILQTQDILTGGGGAGGGGGSSRPVSSHPQAHYGGDEIPDDLSEAQQAYVDAKMASEAARARNRGGGMSDVFSHA